MSAQPSADEHIAAPEAGFDVEIRRNAGLAALLGAAAAGFALAYLSRAVAGGAVLDWVVGAALALLAGSQLLALVDSRTPLMVADETGIRLRLGRQWRGLPWRAIAEVVLEPGKPPLRDGRLVVEARHLNRALEGFDEQANRQVQLSQKLYGAPLAVPLGWTTRVNTDDLVADLRELAEQSGARTPVIELIAPEPKQIESAAEQAPEEEPAKAPRIDLEKSAPTPFALPAAPANPVGPAPRVEADAVGAGPVASQPSGVFGVLAQAVSRLAGRGHDVDAVPAEAGPSGAGQAGVVSPGSLPSPDCEPDPTTSLPVPPAPLLAPAPLLRETRPAARVEVRLTAAEGTLARKLDAEEQRGATLPEHAALVGRDDELWNAATVRPIAVSGPVVEPLVIDDWATEPALEPVIGPEIAAARTRLGLSVEKLSERTQIRPHVLESIEVDDFEPSGGDFYARGHLRAIGRALGLRADDLIATFDARYASAPINARKVFEAELATGMSGGIRTSVAGPRWSLMVAVVLILALAWGVARALTGDSGAVRDPAPTLNGSAGVTSNQAPITADKVAEVKMTVRAERGPSHVVVRDDTGRIVFTGDLAAGGGQQVSGTAPFSVQASDASVVDVWVAGKALGAVGTTPGAAGSGTFR